jgi:hypothetical protein
MPRYQCQYGDLDHMIYDSPTDSIDVFFITDEQGRTWSCRELTDDEDSLERLITQFKDVAKLPLGLQSTSVFCVAANKKALTERLGNE